MFATTGWVLPIRIIMKTEKRCTRCKQIKPLDAFHFEKARREGRSVWCRQCKNFYVKEYRKANPIIDRIKRLKKRFGLTLEEYDKLFKKQNGICAVCGNVNRDGIFLSVDHDHATGEIRGLLCSFCNSALGFARDNPVTLRKLADYLEGV